MRQPQRLTAILARVSERGLVEVDALARELGASESTVRRDLGVLERQRLLTRTHGGAVAAGVSYELPLKYREPQEHTHKLRIARAAIERIGTARSIGLTGGTTTTSIAHGLRGRGGLTVVTNAINIASDLAMRPDLKVVVTGGIARPESYELVGPFAEATLARLNIDIAFVGVDGVSTTAGLSTHHEIEAQTNRALTMRAREVVVVADASKIGKVAFAVICSIADVDELITDDRIGDADVAALEDAGVKVTAV